LTSQRQNSDLAKDWLVLATDRTIVLFGARLPLVSRVHQLLTAEGHRVLLVTTLEAAETIMSIETVRNGIVILCPPLSAKEQQALGLRAARMNAEVYVLRDTVSVPLFLLHVRELML
jgi:hypothetical protein